PAKFVHNQDDRRGTAIESLVSGGCIVSGHVERSVLYSNVRVHSFSRVNWSVLLPDVSVGRGARISRAIIDSRVSIPEGLVIGEDPNLDAVRFYRTPTGVTLVTRDMLARIKA
ncbi:MAG: glucose-1-phosphate adenylyltransferase, partial [Betaproteobacteria bacterium]|nr:glucose-1-phosphate adenylyltransferase [Betaproteobacteria bacterium]